MSELNVERTLVDDWQAFVGAARPDADLAVTIAETRGTRITRPLIWAELEDVRLAFAELRASLDEASKAETLATTRWTVKDLVGHLASWATEFVRQIETVASGREFDYLITFPRVGPTEWNARELERRAAMSLEDRFREVDTATTRLQDLALSLSDEALFREGVLPQTPDGRPETRWRARPADMMLMKCMHDRYHLERLGDVVP
jgi:hypothetical protein